MRRVVLEPLTPKAFAPFGEVLTRPVQGRTYFDRALSNARPLAAPSVSIAVIEDVARLPFTASQMERHQFSSQTFIPLDASRWIVAVAPHAEEGGPETQHLRAFLAEADQGITYSADVWHHPLTVLEQPATFAVLMWRDGTSADEDFVTLAEPIRFETQNIEEKT